MENNKHIPDLSDSDFLSFLYSERERENNIHDFHGWNNWALIGAIITFVCSGYAILKDNPDLRKLTVLYYTISLVSFFLTCQYIETIFRKERKIDFSKVRMMEDVFPLGKVIFIYLFGITSSVLIALYDRCNEVLLLWISIIISYTIVCIIGILNRKKIVPSNITEMTLPWTCPNTVYISLISGAFGIMMTRSFDMAGRTIISPEFGLASCITAVLIMIYVLFKLNYGNEVVMKFDVIIDKYLYAGATKEETFHEILKNRMGYGVIDTCYKELQAVEKQTKLCVEEEKELVEIKKYALSGKCDLKKLQEYQNRLGEILNNQRYALDMTKALTDRLNEIVKVSTALRDVTEIKYVFDANQKCHKKVKSVSDNLSEVFKLLHNVEIQY